jgi:hypothetical protein
MLILSCFMDIVHAWFRHFSSYIEPICNTICSQSISENLHRTCLYPLLSMTWCIFLITKLWFLFPFFLFELDIPKFVELATWCLRFKGCLIHLNHVCFFHIDDITIMHHHYWTLCVIPSQSAQMWLLSHNLCS